MSENEINKSFVNLPKADETNPVHDEPNETVTGASRLSEFEEAIKEASYMLKDALDERGWLKEDELQQLYAARIEDVLGILGKFNRKLSPMGVLNEKFGLKLSRYASEKEIRQIGVRVSHNNEQEVREIWEIQISRRDHSAEIVCDDETVMYMHGSASVGPARLEKCAVSSLLRILNEKTRCAHHRSRAGKEAK